MTPHVFANIRNLTLNVILLSNIAPQLSQHCRNCQNNVVADFHELTAQGKR